MQIALRGDEHDWIAPMELTTGQPEGAPQLTGSSGGPLERSLFLPIYRAVLDDEELEIAVYFDRESAVRWWHRNGTSCQSYGLRGWRRGNVYPDFLLAATRDKARAKGSWCWRPRVKHLAGSEVLNTSGRSSVD